METSTTTSKNILPENIFYGKDAGFLCKLLFFCLFFLIGARTYGQIAKTGAVTDDAHVVENKVIVWAVPAEQKVRPDDRIENNNVIWSKQENKISVAGAGNEHVPFQVVITTPIPEGRRPKAPEGFSIEASSLNLHECLKRRVSAFLQ